MSNQFTAMYGLRKRRVALLLLLVSSYLALSRTQPLLWAAVIRTQDSSIVLPSFTLRLGTANEAVDLESEKNLAIESRPRSGNNATDLLANSAWPTSVSTRDSIPVMSTTQQQGATAEHAESSFPPLWITVVEYAEGMANWRTSFAELLLAAKKMNATLVEPCIFQGRLKQCRFYAAQYVPVRLRDVYNMTEIRNFHPFVASEEEYQHFVQTKKPRFIYTCLHEGTPSPAVACRVIPREYNGTISNYHGASRNVDFEQAMLSGASPTVIKIPMYRKFALKKTTLNGKPLSPPGSSMRVWNGHFHYCQDHYEIVEWLLRQLGIGENDEFNVIHWRAEVVHINYDVCANVLLDMKQALSPLNAAPTVLISSINKEVQLEWETATLTKRHRAAEALKLLLDSGFHKLDLVQNRTIRDMVMLSVWDHIIGERAQSFSTCLKQCKGSPCAACNYGGNFGQVVVDMRRRSGKESRICWHHE